MTWLAANAADDDPAILQAAIALTPQIVEASDLIEQGRRIPSPLAQAMKDAGMLRPRLIGPHCERTC